MKSLVVRFVPIVVAALAGTLPLHAAESIRFARTPDISPDGKQVAFSYLGDIWTVPARGGRARLITMHQAHEYRPIYSPDGRHIAFASRRHGQYDVFVVKTEGGRPTRLTWHSSDDYPCDWSPDGKYVLFSSKRAVEFPPRYELYKVPMAGGRVERMTQHGGRDGAFSPNGKEIAYVRGAGSWYRKGYRGSSNDEIWLCRDDGANNRRLTRFDGRDAYPSWSPDGRFLYYVNNASGIDNIVRAEILSKSGGDKIQPQQITHHKSDSVRRARLSRNGKWLVYECGADLWIADAKGDSPRKLDIEAYADDKTNPERTVTYTSGATEFAVSRDERYIAFVVHGEIFLIPRGGGKAKQLTRHQANDRGLAWAPDSRQLVFRSDRSGQEDIYVLESGDPDHRRLVEAHEFKVRRLTNTPAAEIGVMYSPNGQRISFLRDGELYTMRPDGKDLKRIVSDRTVIDYEWSPDSKWIAYSRLDGEYSSEMFIIPSMGATSANPARNVSRYATYNANITWSRRGHKIAFLSERGIGADRNVFVMHLQKPAVKGAPSNNSIDWEDVHLRVKRITSLAASRAAINKDGSMVAFRSTVGGDDLWIGKSDGTSVKRLTKSNMKPTQIQWSRLLSSLLYFRDGKGNLRMITLSGKTEALRVPFVAKMKVDRKQDYQEIFDQGWRAIEENFYDKKFHGVDWHAIRKKYRPLVRQVEVEEDLHALMYLMLGELNASHLGVRASPPKADAETAELGMLFDDRYAGPGLKIREILRRGPADRRGLNLKTGDVISRINRTPIAADSNLARILNGKVNETVVLEIGGPKNRRVELKATSRKVVKQLMYDRWAEANMEKVTQFSKGRIGYIHIPNMTKSGLDRFVRALYSDNYDKEAIVLDVRFNGGGYTHDKVLQYLGGKDHTHFLRRDGGKGTVFRAGDRKWTKPLVLLINSRSFSDAEIFPSAFRTLGLGKLVGTPTGGRVIGTGSVTLIDGSTFRIPRTGVYSAAGVNLENAGVQPDVFVENHPDQLEHGIDAQLERAVSVVQHDMAQARGKRAANPNSEIPNPKQIQNSKHK